MDFRFAHTSGHVASFSDWNTNTTRWGQPAIFFLSEHDVVRKVANFSTLAVCVHVVSYPVTYPSAGIPTQLRSFHPHSTLDAAHVRKYIRFFPHSQLPCLRSRGVFILEASRYRFAIHVRTHAVVRYLPQSC